MAIVIKHKAVTGRPILKSDYDALDAHVITGTPGKYLGFGSDGRLVELDAPAGGGVVIPTAPTLNSVGLSGSIFNVGSASSGTITGATAGSTLVLTNGFTGLTINSAARTWAYDGTGSASTGSFTMVETLAGATNSPRSTPTGYSVLGTGALSSTGATVVSAPGAALNVAFNFPPDIQPGMYLRSQRTNTAGNYTTVTLEVVHEITIADIENGFVDQTIWADEGYVPPSGVGAEHYRFETIDGLQIGPYTEVLFNVNAFVATWVGGDYGSGGVNKSQYLKVVDPANLKVFCGAAIGAPTGVRSTTGVSSGKHRVVHNFDGLGGKILLGIIDAGTPIGPNFVSYPGMIGFPGSSVEFNNAGDTSYGPLAVFRANNDSDSTVALPGSGAPVLNDQLIIEFDPDLKTIDYRFKRVGGSIVLLNSVTLTLASCIPSGAWHAYFAGSYGDLVGPAGNNDGVTSDFGTTNGAYTGW